MNKHSFGTKPPLWIYALGGGLGIVLSHLLIIPLLEISGMLVYVADFVVILLCIIGLSMIYQKRT